MLPLLQVLVFGESQSAGCISETHGLGLNLAVSEQLQQVLTTENVAAGVAPNVQDQAFLRQQLQNADNLTSKCHIVGNIEAAKPEKAEPARLRALHTVLDLIREYGEVAQRVFSYHLPVLHTGAGRPGHHFHLTLN